MKLFLFFTLLWVCPLYSESALSQTEQAIVNAIQQNDRKKIIEFIHPKCISAYQGQNHISAFVNMLTEYGSLPKNIEVTKGPALPKTSAIYKINEFIVPPTHNIGIGFKNSQGKPKGITLTLEITESSCYIVTYISDYILEKHK